MRITSEEFYILLGTLAQNIQNNKENDIYYEKWKKIGKSIGFKDDLQDVLLDLSYDDNMRKGRIRDKLEEALKECNIVIEKDRNGNEM